MPFELWVFRLRGFVFFPVFLLDFGFYPDIFSSFGPSKINRLAETIRFLLPTFVSFLSE